MYCSALCSGYKVYFARIRLFHCNCMFSDIDGMMGKVQV
jgi:hypothetical protein